MYDPRLCNSWQHGGCGRSANVPVSTPWEFVCKSCRALRNKTVMHLCARGTSERARLCSGIIISFVSQFLVPLVYRLWWFPGSGGRVMFFSPFPNLRLKGFFPGAFCSPFFSTSNSLHFLLAVLSRSRWLHFNRSGMPWCGDVLNLLQYFSTGHRRRPAHTHTHKPVTKQAVETKRVPSPKCDK